MSRKKTEAIVVNGDTTITVLLFDRREVCLTIQTPQETKTVTCRVGGKIVMGSVAITILSIERDKIRFGIEAPRSVPVHRQEVQDRINEAKAKK